MREFKLKKWVAAGLLVSMPYASIVDAAGLGRLNVLSQLGQPFSAEIDLINVSKAELATLKANLASPSAYQAANLQYNSSLNALRLTIERRSDGTSFIKAASFRPVAEPFLDLLIEVVWQGGKLVREYSALLDPPGLDAPVPAVTAPVVAAPAVTPSVAMAPAGKPPTAIEAPAPATPAPVARPVPAPVRTAGTGPVSVKFGDTLNGIATSVKPEGVSLEQTLIGLFRANPDAFSNSNINQLRAGKILNVPEREKLAAIAQGEATQVVRVHATNWNSYRQKVAEAAPSAADAAPSAKGKITARVEDKATSGPKDVVVLSKADTGVAGKDGKSANDRLRALQEDLAARDKALAEANARVTQLEKTLKDMQKLAEIKNSAMAAAQQAAKGAAPKVEPPKAESAKVEPPKPEAKAPDAPKVEAPPPAPIVQPPVPAPAPAPKKAVTPPSPEPSIMDTVMDNIVPIGGGAAALLAGIAGFWALRRRKQNANDDDQPVVPTFKTEPSRGNADADADAGVAAATATATAALVPSAVVPEATVSNVSDVVDPIDEAQVYIDHGRDAQAEDILKEAMGKQPEREDLPLKLLEVYAARGDKNSFNSVAKQFHALTGGNGENWNRAAVMGYALDPGHALYPTTGDVVDLTQDPSAGNVDLDLGGSESDALGTTTDILLDQGSTAEEEAELNKTMVLSRDEPKPAVAEAAPAAMDFNIELPAASVPEAPVAPATTNMMEFNLDPPSASAPAESKAAPAAKADDGGLDFKVDFSGIDLNLDDKTVAPAVAAGGGAKDANWEDVQQKFDLARAYQEMGDKEGAVEILHEVEREGDAEQKSEAQKML